MTVVASRLACMGTEFAAVIGSAVEVGSAVLFCAFAEEVEHPHWTYRCMLHALPESARTKSVCFATLHLC